MGHQQLINNALKGDKWALGRLISIFEDKRRYSLMQRREIMKHVTSLSKQQLRQARFIGFTGAPGVGKSSLIGKLVQHLLKTNPHIRLAVLAIDPSSTVSGGSFLGDRTRVRFHFEKEEDKERFFFRSQATDKELGGLSRTTFFIARLLYFLFDLVFIETVGVGQNEVEVQFLTDCTVLVLQPSSGDQIQFFKAGIMEVPDIFVINKCDQIQAAQKDLYTLGNSLSLLYSSTKRAKAPILLTSTTKQQGISELSTCIQNTETKPPSWQDKEDYYFKRWVRDEFGRQGMEKLYTQGSPRQIIEQASSFEDAQLQFMRECQWKEKSN